MREILVTSPGSLEAERFNGFSECLLGHGHSLKCVDGLIRTYRGRLRSASSRLPRASAMRALFRIEQWLHCVELRRRVTDKYYVGCRTYRVMKFV